MKTLDVALIEYIEKAPFFSDFGAVRNDLLETSNDLPALIYEVMPKDYQSATGSDSGTVLFAIVGESTDPTLLDLMEQLIAYIEIKRGDVMEGVSMEKIARMSAIKTNSDTKNKQIQYMISYDMEWLSVT